MNIIITTKEIIFNLNHSILTKENIFIPKFWSSLVDFQTKDFGSAAWWNHIAGDVSNIVGMIQKLGLFNLTSIDLNNVDMKTVLPYIQELIYRNGPDALADR